MLPKPLSRCMLDHEGSRCRFYRRHFDLVSKFGAGLKSYLQQGLSEPAFYGDLVYKFRKIYAFFSTRFRKIILRYIKIGYNITLLTSLVARRRVGPHSMTAPAEGLLSKSVGA